VIGRLLYAAIAWAATVVACGVAIALWGWWSLPLVVALFVDGAGAAWAELPGPRS
jgi:hypothetical protein